MNHRRVAFVASASFLTVWSCNTEAASPDQSSSLHGTAPAHHHTSHKTHRHAQAASLAPLASTAAAPPAAPTSSPAPVPNEALNAPIDNTSTETTAAPRVFQLHYPPQGDGYTTGSSSQALDDREAAKATGVEVKVPLPQ